MQALSPDPRDRPASALEMAASLPEHRRPRRRTAPSPPASAPPVERRDGGSAGAALAAVVAVAGRGVVVLRLARRAARLTERDTIVLADFENTTGEPVFDGALKVALAVALEQSPFLKVFPDDRARETLRLMQRSPDERITRSIAREIARREQLKALLAGSIASLGRNYVLALEAINAETGDVMAREQAEAGEQGAGADVARHGDVAAAREAGRVARVDPEVRRPAAAGDDAVARRAARLLAGALRRPRGAASRGDPAPQARDRARPDVCDGAGAAVGGLRQHRPDRRWRRRFRARRSSCATGSASASGSSSRGATTATPIQAWDKALELARSWTATYPREAFAFNSLGSALIRFGQFEQSVAAVARSDPSRSAVRSRLFESRRVAAGAQSARPRRRAVLQQAADRQLDFIGARRLSYLLAFVQGDAKTMARELESSVGVRETNAAFGWQAHTSAFDGRVKAAHEQFRRGIQMSLQGNFAEVAAQLTMEDAEIHAMVGQCAEARSEVPPRARVEPRQRHARARQPRPGAVRRGQRGVERCRTSWRRRFPEATLTVRVSLPVTAAALAIQRGDAGARARTAGAGQAVRSRAVGGVLAGLPSRPGLPAAEGRRGGRRPVPEHPGPPRRGAGVDALSPRASRPRSCGGVGQRPEHGRAQYDRLLTLWKEADSDLQPLQDARLEQSRLR